MTKIPPPNMENHAKRMALISLAIDAVKAAQEIGTFTTEFDRAIDALKMAALQTSIDFNNRLKASSEGE